MKKILLLTAVFLTLFSCENDNELKEDKIVLKTDVIDAEYSKKSDQIVYISSNPSQINIFNTNSETTESIPLIHKPTCLSVSLDAKTAVVGHDGHITYINLATKSIINTYDISCDALDIVLGNDKWAYVFPKKDQWTYVRSINMNLLQDNEEPINIYNQIYAGTKGRLHPSGKYIYAQNSTSRAIIERFNIQNGNIDNNFESKYEEGGYVLIKSIWFSEDGNRLFSSNRSVLKTSELNSQDMVFNGKIEADLNSNVEWLDHSAAKNNLYLILSNGNYYSQVKSPYIYVYNDSNLTFKSKLELEKFSKVNKNTVTYYDAEPQFVFSDSTGDNLFVITKAVQSDLDNEWGIQKLKVQ
ncbi:hypothetical protein [Flavobacterium sp. N502540]|uniref:hypothetical protein n=1 Tax=Flavobacterium sp. N502540 TaxID=2986838 RepID=UPI0022255603|nr:hypothetical protein [Flavobacterium sp. N502540]